ncbi:MAG: hypothetical protein NT145_00095 [Elusimicrobia bacterium]|nr:hypothetical protein [Elusimicrobiota bacterium]
MKRFIRKTLILMFAGILFQCISYAGLITDRAGIGNVSNPNELEVKGRVTTSSFTMITNAQNGYILTSDSLGKGTWQTNVSTSALKADILASTNTWTAPNTWTSSATFRNSAFSVGLSTFVVTGGNIGVGNSSPNEKLTVSGIVSLSKNSFPSSTASFGKIFVSTDSQAWYVDENGIKTQLSYEYAIYEDQRVSGTNGGTFTLGAWQIRILNTTVASRGTSISRAGNVITLSAGTYRIVASAPGYRSQNHKARFFNITDNAVAIYGTSEYSDGVVGLITTRSLIEGVITISAQKSFQLEHRCTRTQNNTGLGVASSFGGGDQEVYSRVYIQKITGIPKRKRIFADAFKMV